ncbi:glyoxylate/hydroxypyruvate reductase A [Xenophilus aerolatus]|nr:glyoxylate/hydroxypyruvate reductase A [Xenophilus aerolatus]
MSALLLHAGPVPVDELCQALEAQLPDLSLRVWPEIGDPRDVEFALVSRVPHGVLQGLPNLRLVGSLHAGVDHLLRGSEWPASVHLTRPIARDGDPLMSEFILTQVLMHHRDMPSYIAAQREVRWKKLPPVPVRQRRVGFLGYGSMAAPAAALLAQVGFDVMAWARRPWPASAVTVLHGEEGLRSLLSRSDVLVNLLPLTPETENILNARLLQQLPQGARLINVGRGEHLVEQDLLAALDSGRLSSATLDVFREEPLAPDSPLWRHPRIVVTPHACRSVDVADVVAQFAASVRRLRQGLAPLDLVDTRAGY